MNLKNGRDGTPDYYYHYCVVSLFSTSQVFTCIQQWNIIMLTQPQITLIKRYFYYFQQQTLKSEINTNHHLGKVLSETLGSSSNNRAHLEHQETNSNRTSINKTNTNKTLINSNQQDRVLGLAGRAMNEVLFLEVATDISSAL